MEKEMKLKWDARSDVRISRIHLQKYNCISEYTTLLH
jgi:hypothetical protein